MEPSASVAGVPTSRLTISLPQRAGSPLALEMMNENSTSDDGSNTAPIFVGPPDQQRPRHFSFGEATDPILSNSIFPILCIHISKIFYKCV
jgi:hypothetical protein